MFSKSISDIPYELLNFLSCITRGLFLPVISSGYRSTLTGSQRQRLGIARGMFTQPHLLVLDGASISESIRHLRGSTTVIMIAHRLSSVRDADMVIYLSGGKNVAARLFDEVRNSAPDFDH